MTPSGRAGERSFAGALFLIPGAALAWALLGWAGEADARRELARGRAGLEKRVEQLESAQDGLLVEKARLECRLLEQELRRRRQLDSITALGARLQEIESQADEVAAPATATDRDRLRARVELTRKVNRLIRRNGADWVRFLEIAGREGRSLLGVRLLLLDEDGLPDGAFLAERCALELDRGTGLAALVLSGVVRVIDRARLPRIETHRVEFEPPDVRGFEVELAPYLSIKGEYPAPEAKAPLSREDLEELLLWRDRLTAFLARAGGEDRLELHRLEDLGPAAFLGVEVLGYTKKGLWLRRLKAARLEVWVDEDTEAVELRLQDGFMDSSAGRTAFPAERSFRYPLRGLSRSEAERLLTGFVHRFRSLSK